MLSAPAHWELVKLGDYVDLIRGASPRPKGDPRYFGGNIPWISIKDVNSEKGKYLSKTAEFVTEAGAEKSRYLAEGTLILSNSASVCIPKILKVKGCIHDGFLAFPNLEKSFDKYYFYYLFDWMRPFVIDQNRQGVTQVNLNTAIVKAFDIPIPPLREQKRIVEKLDSLLAQVETIQQRLNILPDTIKRFRQSVLAAAVSGKLTEQWRHDNSEIKPIHSDKTKNERELSSVGKEEHYGIVPKVWRWKRLGNLVKLINGDRGKNYPNKSEYVEDGIPFINTGHIEPSGSLCKSKMNYITKEKFNSLGSGKVQTNDLVYCLRGTMGKTAMVAPYTEGAIASSLVIVRPSNFITQKFCYFYLVSPQAKDLITRFENGSAQPNLSAKSLAMYPIALPSIDEQTEIVRLVEQYFALADTLEKHLADAKARVDNLTQSILAKAFRGELVPQDPNDEPADKLLERIKAARLEAEKLEKAAKKAAKVKQ